jgi:hypothetical protein
VVKQRRLRSGGFAARLPGAPSARYLLSARVGRRTLRRLTIVTPRTTPPVRDAPPPAPPSSGGRCAAPQSASSAAALTGDRGVLSPGETLTLTIANTGTACLSGGVGYTIEARSGSGWVPVDLRLLFPALAIRLEPGATRQVVFTAPAGAEMAPGRYRLTQQYSGATGPVAVAWEFDYVWPNPGPNPDSCGPANGVVRAEATLDRTSATAGQQIVMTVRNSGERCLQGDDMRFSLERQTGPDTWAPVELIFPALPIRWFRYEPGRSLDFTFAVDGETMPPGHYRATYMLRLPPESDAIQQPPPVVAEFDVVAPAG